MVTSVLTNNHIVLQLRGCRFPDFLDDVSAGRPYGCGRHVTWRFHRDDSQQLQQVALKHVADRPDLLEISASFVDADVFEYRYLDMIHVQPVPQWLEYRVAKMHGKDILHGFLRQLMVNPVNLFFSKILVENFVQAIRGARIKAERLLQQNASFALVPPASDQEPGFF